MRQSERLIEKKRAGRQLAEGLLLLCLLASVARAAPSTRPPQAAERLRQALPNLRYRDATYDILKQVLAATPAQAESAARLARWQSDALASPFILRDVFLARFIRQRALLALLAQAAPRGLAGVSLWLGGDDLDPVFGRFPWSTMEVALVPTSPTATDAARACEQRLARRLEPVRDLPGHLRLRRAPGAGGLTVQLTELQQRPTLWMEAFRHIYERTGGAAISEAEWRQWVTIFTERPRGQDQALLEWRFPELKEVLRQPSFVRLFTRGWAEPHSWSELASQLEGLQQLFRERRHELPALEAGLAAWRRALPRTLAREVRALCERAAAWYHYLGDVAHRAEQARAIVPPRGSFSAALQSFLALMPEVYYDRYNLIAFRDDALLRFTLQHARTAEELLLVDGLFSVEGWREYRALVEELARRVAAAQGSTRAELWQRLRTKGTKTALLALTSLAQQRPAPSALGFVPYRRLRDIVRFDGSTSELFAGAAVRAKILQAFLETRFSDGLYVQAHDSLDEDLPFLKQSLERFLAAPAPAAHYLVAREFVRAVPHANDQELFNTAKSLSLLIDQTHSGFYAIRQNIHNHTSLRDVSDTAAFLAKLESKRPRDERAISLTRRLLTVLRKIYAVESRLSEWSLGNARLAFGATVRASQGVLPEGALGFLDNVVRSSTLLAYDRLLTEVLRLEERTRTTVHRLAGQDFPLGVRGLNAGVARGTLVFVEEATLRAGHVRYDRDKIYVLATATSELGPVGGVLSQDTGSAISHVQLLARNLGVPNAVISSAAREALRSLAGSAVLYIVYPDGKVWLDLEARAGAEEQQLLAAQRATATRITLPPVDENFERIIPLSTIGMVDSGKKAGPKAANLGELHRVGLGQYVPQGVVIPFGVYAKLAQAAGLPRLVGEWIGNSRVRGDHQLLAQKLAATRAAIQALPLEAKRGEALWQLVHATFGDHGLFVRSDTNVEDLPSFTGAGLNKTVPNVVGRQALLAAVRTVWASPWAERSFSWRAGLIKNLDYVFPSVLIMEAQAAQKAGVMITRDIETDDSSKVFISAHEGLGIKVVDGSETPQEVVYDPATGRSTVLTFAKAQSKLVAAAGGGVRALPRTGGGRVLSQQEIAELGRVAQRIREAFAQHRRGDWDIEWLIDEHGELRIVQARPYVQQAWSGAAHDNAH